MRESDVHIGADLQCKNVDVLVHRDLYRVSIVSGNGDVRRVSIDMHWVTDVPRQLHMSWSIDVRAAGANISSVCELWRPTDVRWRHFVRRIGIVFQRAEL